MSAVTGIEARQLDLIGMPGTNSWLKSLEQEVFKAQKNGEYYFTYDATGKCLVSRYRDDVVYVADHLLRKDYLFLDLQYMNYRDPAAYIKEFY